MDMARDGRGTAAEIKIKGGKKDSKLPASPRRAVRTPQVEPMPGMAPLGVPGKAPAEPTYAPGRVPAPQQPVTPEDAPAMPASPTTVGDMVADAIDAGVAAADIAREMTDAQRLMIEDGAPGSSPQ
jgi:hypothetical protein